MSGYEGAEYDGVDALLAALTDEPLPEGARQDAAFLAEHRAAVADVALLRDQLRLMGDALAAGEEPPAGPRAPEAVPRASRTSPPPGPPGRPKPAGPRRPGRYRHYARAAAGALVLTGGTALLGGLVWLGVQGSGGDDAASGKSAAGSQQESSADLDAGRETHLACSKVLVEGTVRSIASAGGGNVRVVLEVKRSYRPERPATDHPTITVTLPESAREDLGPGTYTLVRVPVHAQDRTDWETGPGVADARRDILQALPGARGMTCPDPEEGRG
ncbi:hypothetical protein [Streptomyces apricus]|uniref:Uncharacterized protein n=1 Tax=Streptomyces apricus TaxID=1828112 RepID=A0A5B0AT07_9ACTN|nr:hypothetical protein [Streptomyces apricus]KAA0932261.1 hypothetical protein FGF04_26140 [Streptomyces apricus]